MKNKQEHKAVYQKILPYSVQFTPIVVVLIEQFVKCHFIICVTEICRYIQISIFHAFYMYLTSNPMCIGRPFC